MNFFFFITIKVVLAHLANVSDPNVFYDKIFMNYFNLGGFAGGPGANGLPGFPGPKGLPGTLFPQII